MNIIITGASRGIGFDTALQLASTSKNNLLALSRDETNLKKLASLAAFDNLDYLVFDINQPDFSALLQKVDAMGSVDVLLHNAGLLIAKPFRELTAGDWQQSFATNILSVVELTRVLLPYLEKSHQAHIINIGSMGGFQGSAKFPGLSAYSASKAAVANLTECLAEELKDENIRVNCLAFGAVQTEMLETAFPGFQAPLSSSEMAEWVAWFCTNGQKFFNGKVLPVSVSTP